MRTTKEVQIPDQCEIFIVEAYVLAGEAIDANGNFYPRYPPCGQCQERGEQDSWVNRLEFLDLLGQ